MGWNPEWAETWDQVAATGFPGRVVRQDSIRFRVVLGEPTQSGDTDIPTTERTVTLAGRLRNEAESRGALPVVGDWVSVTGEVIDAVLPRRSSFVRKVAGETTVEQVVAANIDTVFLVVGMDGDFNPRRVERYLTATWESGASPVIVLNKSDLAGDQIEDRKAEIEAVAMGVPTVAVSALQEHGLSELADWLQPGRTVALLGSSGVGKSTMVNALAGANVQDTGAVRDSDSRGRHTTTHRELVCLPSGAVLMDTPGMRELQLWGTESGLEETFPEITALAASCRFSDCRHETEPGCSILSALEDGTLDSGRLQSWRKMQRELARLAMRQNLRAKAAEKAKWKSIRKTMKHHPKADRWRKD